MAGARPRHMRVRLASALCSWPATVLSLQRRRRGERGGGWKEREPAALGGPAVPPSPSPIVPPGGVVPNEGLGGSLQRHGEVLDQAVIEGLQKVETGAKTCAQRGPGGREVGRVGGRAR